jgi:hypothetical protein
MKPGTKLLPLLLLFSVGPSVTPVLGSPARHDKNVGDMAREYRVNQQPTGAPTLIAEAKAAVRANLQTSDGPRYDAEVAREFGERYVHTMQVCVDAAAGNAGNFEIFMRIAQDGAVQEVITEPAAGVAGCVRQELAKDSFPPPPRPSYWVNISMRIEP